MHSAAHARRRPGPASRLINAIMPPDWPSRTAALTAAKHVADKHAGVTLNRLIDAWQRWHRVGELPPTGPMRDLVATLAHPLVGVALKLRQRPREAGERHGRNND